LIRDELSPTERARRAHALDAVDDLELLPLHKERDRCGCPCRSSPNLNAFAESLRSFDQAGVSGARGAAGRSALRELVNEYVQHYQHERPHQGLGGEALSSIEISSEFGRAFGWLPRPPRSSPAAARSLVPY